MQIKQVPNASDIAELSLDVVFGFGTSAKLYFVRKWEADTAVSVGSTPTVTILPDWGDILDIVITNVPRESIVVLTNGTSSYENKVYKMHGEISSLYLCLVKILHNLSKVAFIVTDRNQNRMSEFIVNAIMMGRFAGNTIAPLAIFRDEDVVIAGNAMQFVGTVTISTDSMIDMQSCGRCPEVSDMVPRFPCDYQAQLVSSWADTKLLAIHTSHVENILWNFLDLNGLFLSIGYDTVYLLGSVEVCSKALQMFDSLQVFDMKGNNVTEMFSTTESNIVRYMKHYNIADSEMQREIERLFDVLHVSTEQELERKIVSLMPD